MTQNTKSHLNLNTNLGPYLDIVPLESFRIIQTDKLTFSDSDEFRELEKRLGTLLNKSEMYFTNVSHVTNGREKTVQAFAFGESIHHSYFYYPIYFHVQSGEQYNLNQKKIGLCESIPEHEEVYRPTHSNVASMCYLFRDYENKVIQIFNYYKNFKQEAQLGLMDYAKKLWAEREYHLLDQKLTQKQTLRKSFKI